LLPSCRHRARAAGPRAGQPTLRLMEHGQSAARSGSAGLFRRDSRRRGGASVFARARAAG
jgi:hypothetical protein